MGRDLIDFAIASYKVIAKVVANCMKVVLDSIVSTSQSAFVPDRLIMDNIIVAGEIGHFLRRKREGLVGWAALKLDMAKAYDHMEWGFLEGMVVPTRGIRQGDPISPYHFIVCAEGLSLLLQQVEARGDIHGVRVARGAPLVTHLFFVDDRRDKSSVFHYIEQRVRDRVSAWFWWQSGGAERRGIHWMSWARLALPMCYDGMGFKNMHEFNISLLAKQGWRILIKPDSLVCKLLKARYFPHSDFLDATLGHNPSYIWRSILAAQELLIMGIGRRIGDGRDTLIWGPAWLADKEDPRLHTACVEELRVARENSQMTPEGVWDDEVLIDLFLPTDVCRINHTPISPG
ncbi:PREDICTED: uncharacterized protein LOC109164733 [Ipomoea nil]|uniref:uncharacterized protein LOC109164733 n=1 Tax=Ipomoea nil TaxID=35883 RepID=UPI000900FF88|nr:PREDICTED: uncharacterized protein LOC109164733 [Ipomoea nil]